MKKTILVFLLGVALVGCSSTKKKGKIPEEERVLVRVGKEEIKKKDLDTRIQKMEERDQEYYETSEGREALLDEMSDDLMLQQEAKKEDISKDERYQKDLEKEKNKLLVKYLITKNIIDNIKVSEDEIKKEYEETKENFKVEERVRAAHILIKVDKNMGKKEKEEKRRLAEKILKEANPDNFARLAKKYSQGPTAVNGGELGWFTKGTMVEAFSEPAFTGVPGNIYRNVVETQFGYHIIFVEDRKEEGYQPLEEVREALREEILNKKRAQEYKRWMEKLRKEYIKKENK